MKNSILMILAVLCAASNLSAVRRQDVVSAAQDLVEKRAQAQEVEQAKAAAAATQLKPKAQKIKKQTQEKQETNAQQAPQNDAPKANEETTASSTTSTQEAPQEQEVPVVAAQASSYAARALKVGAAVGFAGVVGASTLAACKAYMLANPVVYPVLVHNTIAGASWCFAHCL